jgi:hypothetical protein
MSNDLRCKHCKREFDNPRGLGNHEPQCEKRSSWTADRSTTAPWRSALVEIRKSFTCFARVGLRLATDPTSVAAKVEDIIASRARPSE